MKRPPIRLARLLSASMLLATTLPSAGVNPKYGLSDSDECQPCKEDGNAGVDSADTDIDSIDLVLNIGRAGYERPNLFPSFYTTTKEYIGDGRRPQSPGQLQGYFDSAPIVGRFPATLRLKTTTIDAGAFSPAALTYNETMKMEVLKDDNGVIRQVLTSDFLVDIQTLGPVGGSPREGYEAKWYSAVGHEEWQKDGKFYPLPGPDIKSVTVSNPAPLATYDTLEVLMRTDSGSGSPRKVFYRYHFVSNTHTLETWEVNVDNIPTTMVREEILDYVSGSPGANDHSKIRTIKVRNLDAGGSYGNFTVISRVLEDYDNVAGMSRMVSSSVLGSETATGGGLQTTFGYYDTTQAPTPNPDLDGRPRWRIDPDGSWVVWDITSGANSIKEITPVGNAALPFTSGVPSPTEAACRVVTNTYVSASKTTLVKVLGKTVSSGSETFLNGSGGERVLEKLRNDGTADHVSYRAENAYGNGSAAGAGRIAWIVREDGTATTYSYAPNGFDGVTVTEITGAASGISRTSAPAMVSGTTTVTAYNEFWEPVSVYEYDGITAAGTALRSWTSTAQDVDDFGRPGDRIWSFGGVAGGTETFDYDCCGLRKHVGRDGSITMTYRDVLKRVWKVENQAAASGPVIATTTARSGLETTVMRGGLFASKTSRTFDGLAVINISPSNTSDVADRLTTRSVTVPATRTTTESYLSGIDEEENDIWTDLSATTRYLDGSTHTVSGPAVTDVTYAYSSHAESGGGLVTTTTVSGIASSTYTDRLGRTLKTVSPATGTTNHDYYVPGDPSGSRGRLKSVTDADGVSTTYEYNGEGEQTTTTRVVPEGTNRTATDLATTITSDVATAPEIHNVNLGTCYRQIQKLGVVTVATTYRSLDGLKSATTSLQGDTLTVSTLPDEDGVATSTTIAPDGTKTVSTSTHGLITTVARQTTTGGPIASMTYAYDVNQRLLAATDSETGTTSYDLDDDDLADVTESGQVLKIKAPNGDKTTYVYDLFGRPTRTDLQRGTAAVHSTHTSYDEAGRVAGRWGSQTYPTYSLYNERGQLTDLATFKSLTTEPTGTGSADAVTQWHYSATTGLLVEKTFPDGADADSARDSGGSYLYTPAGRLWKRTSARDIVTTYGHTDGFLTSIEYSDDDTPDVTYTYDSLGRRETVSNTLASSTFEYATDLGIAKETITYTLPGQSTFTRVIDRRSRSLGRDTGWELGISGADLPEHQASYAYDTATGFLETVAGGVVPDTSTTGDPQDYNAADTFTYGYLYNQTDPGDPRVGATDGAGLKQGTMPYTLTRDGAITRQTLRTYEAARDVLRSIENKFDNTLVSGYTYTVNELGQRTALATNGTAFVAVKPAWSWHYDTLGQLERADTNSAGNDRSYRYDTIGNRVTSADGDWSLNTEGQPVFTPTLATSYFGVVGESGPSSPGATALNQYAAITRGATTFQPTHDAEGNQQISQIRPLGATSLVPCVYHWDAENRLVEVRAADDTAVILTCAYDASSRLISRADSTTTTIYIYDGWNRIAEYTAETDTGNPPVTTHTLAKTYLWGMDLSGTMQGAGGVGGLLAVAQDGSTFYPAYDGNGNVSEYVQYQADTDPVEDGDQPGAVVAAHFEYDPYGNLTAFTESAPGLAATFAYRFSTKPLDPATGLYYYGYRWYDPLTGRWPSRDPIGEGGGLNLYCFVGNDGTNKLDKVGLDGYFKVTEEVIEGTNPNVPDSMKFPLSERGFRSEYFKDESEPCEYEKIKIVQVISASGKINIAPKVDVTFRDQGPGYNEGSKYPETDGTITDAPGAEYTDKEATFYIEDCAYCCLGIFPGERLLGCIRFNFDNKLRTVEPRQDNAKEIGPGEYEIPAYKPETRLFWAGWNNWKKIRKSKAS